MPTDGLSAALGALPAIFAFLVLTPPLVAIFYGWIRGYQPVWAMALLETVAVFLQALVTGLAFWKLASLAASGEAGTNQLVGLASAAAFLVGLLWRFAVYRQGKLRPYDLVFLSAIFPAVILLVFFGGIFRQNNRTTALPKTTVLSAAALPSPFPARP